MTDQKVKAKIQLPFNQMPHWLNCRTEINQNAKAIYGTLWGYGYKSGRYFAGIEKLSIDTGLCEKTVFNSLLRLEKLNLIRKCQRGNRQTNEYFFIDSHPWEQEWIEGRDKTYSQVNGKIYDSEPETEILIGKTYESEGGLTGKIYDSLIDQSLIIKQDSNVSCPLREQLTDTSIFKNGELILRKDPVDWSRSVSRYLQNWPSYGENALETFIAEVVKLPVNLQAISLLMLLNQYSGKHFRPVLGSYKLIMARLNEGYTWMDLNRIIVAQCKKWGKDPAMRQYLRPKTLFNETNCAQYLGELQEIGSTK